jgi:hypothetical protein
MRAHIVTVLPGCPDKGAMGNAIDGPTHEIFDSEPRALLGELAT